MSVGNIFTNIQDGKTLYSGNDSKKYQASLSGSSRTSSGGLATMQNSGGVPNINSVQLPSWLQTNPDSSMQELISEYGGIKSAFDPTGQVDARNAAIGYNSAAGGQAANNAATEYSNRAAQSGASQLGAGVVKAQAMLPVLQQNANLRTDAADVAAKSHQQGAALASQIAGTIANLRTSYLSTLTGYAEGQQKLQLQSNQFNTGLAFDQQKFNYGVQQDQQSRADQQRQQQLALAQSTSRAAPTTSGPSSNYTVRPSLGADTHMAVFNDSMLYGNQLSGSTYQRQANNQLQGLLR